MRILPALALAFLAVLPVAAGRAATADAASPAELLALLARADEGGTIRLGGGDWGEVRIQGVRPPAEVRLVPADSKSPPQFSRLTIGDSANLSLEALRFRPKVMEGKRFGFALDISKSEKIALERLDFEGDAAAQAARARALQVTDSREIALRDSRLVRLDRGAILGRSRELTLEHNLVTGMIVDGFNLYQVEDVRILGNRMESFVTGKDHPDFIQFWTNRTESPSRNILIEGNLLRRGSGNIVQGILMGNEFHLPYENVAIRHNVILQESPHGISLYEARKAQVQGNIALSLPDSRYRSAIRLVKVTDADIRDNTATAYDLKTSKGRSQRNRTISIRDKERLADFQRAIDAAIAEGGTKPILLPGGVSLPPELRHAGPRQP